MTTSFVRLVLVFFKLVLLIQYLQPILDPPFDIGVYSSATSLVQSEWINEMLRLCTPITDINFIVFFLAGSKF
jgi:hypothetical protein